MARPTGVYGDQEVTKGLRDLAQGLPLKDVDAAAIASMDPMLEDAKERARGLRNYPGKYPGFPDPKSPRKGGHLDQGLAVRRTDGDSTHRTYWLGARRRAIKLAHLIEFGTAPHWQPHFRGGFLHPGAKAEPFMRPAFEANADEVPTTFGKRLWTIISRKVTQLSR